MNRKRYCLRSVEFFKKLKVWVTKFISDIFQWGKKDKIIKILDFLTFLGKAVLLSFFYIFIYFILIRMDFLSINVFFIGALEKVKFLRVYLIFVPAIIFVLPSVQYFIQYFNKAINTIATMQFKSLENLGIIFFSSVFSICICMYLFKAIDIVDFSAFAVAIFSLLLSLHIYRTCSGGGRSNIINNTKILNSSSDSLKISPDVPIDDINRCSSSRKYFIKELGESLKGQGRDNIIYGLHGKWGEGKTSMLKVLEKELKDDFVFMFFSPNEYHTEEAIVHGFYRELENKFKEYYIIDSEFESFLNQYIKQLIYKNNNSFISSLSSFFIEPETHENLRKKIQTQITNSKKEFIIVIDDFDRLNADEVQAVFRIVRNNSNFKHTKYIICYDPATLSEILEKTKFPDDFLDKLVQVHIQMPKASYYELREFIVKECSILKHELGKFAGREFELLANFRNAKRFIGIMKTLYLSMEDFVRFKDFFWISILKLSHPSLHEDIRTNKDFYCGIHQTNDLDGAGKKAKYLKDKARILQAIDSSKKKLSEDKVEQYKVIIFQLFQFLIGDSFVEKPIASPDYFDNYFFINRNVINDRDIQAFLDKVFSDKEYAKRAVEKLYIEKTKQPYKDFLEAFERALKAIKGIHAEGLFSFILNHEQFLSGDEAQARIEFDLLEVLLFKESVDKKSLFLEMLEKTKQSYYVYIADILKRAHDVTDNKELMDLFLERLKHEFINKDSNIFESAKEQKVDDLIHYWAQRIFWTQSEHALGEFNDYLWKLVDLNNDNRNSFFRMINNLLKKDALYNLADFFRLYKYADMASENKKHEKVFLKRISQESVHNLRNWKDKNVGSNFLFKNVDIDIYKLEDIKKTLVDAMKKEENMFRPPHVEANRIIKEIEQANPENSDYFSSYQTICNRIEEYLQIKEGSPTTDDQFIYGVKVSLSVIKTTLENSQALTKKLTQEIGEAMVDLHNEASFEYIKVIIKDVNTVLDKYKEKIDESKFDRLCDQLKNVQELRYYRHHEV